MVVAHKCKYIPSRSFELLIDALGALNSHYMVAICSAVTFTEFTRQVIHSANTENGRSYNISITGHFIGGWLAQITALTVKCLMESGGVLIKNTSGEFHAKAVVFESPGAMAILNKIKESQAVSVSLDALDITIYVLRPNLFNTCGAHLEKVYCFNIETQNFIDDMHNLDNMNEFIKAFRCKNPEKNKLADWAKATAKLDSSDYIEKNGIMILKGFLIEKLDRCKCKSKKDDKTVVSELSCFSEDELKVLNMLYFLQEKKSGDDIIKHFISQNKLLIANENLFPEFEIDLYNKIIMGKSRKSLDELTKRLKQLMRWLGPQFTMAVEEQIVAFHTYVSVERKQQTVDSLYRAEEKTYLDSLPKIMLNFNDSIGLRDFLLSDADRVLSVVTRDGTFEMTRIYNIFTQLKKNVEISDPIYKYTRENHYAFLDWPRLQKLLKMSGLPSDQYNLMMVDGILSSTVNLEDCTFLNNYTHCSTSNMKKLVFVSSKQIEIFNFLQNIKIFDMHHKISLMDLTDESQDIVLDKIKSGEFPKDF